MISAKHGDQVALDGIHIIHTYEYADNSARTGASGFISTDVGKVAKQTDDLSWWLLTETDPTWTQINTSAPGGGGDDQARYVVSESTGSLPNAYTIEAGPNITINSGSNILSISGSAGAQGPAGEGDDQARYVVSESTGSLPNAYTIEAGPNITINSGSGILSLTGSASSTPPLNFRAADFYTLGGESSPAWYASGSNFPINGLILPYVSSSAFYLDIPTATRTSGDLTLKIFWFSPDTDAETWNLNVDIMAYTPSVDTTSILLKSMSTAPSANPVSMIDTVNPNQMIGTSINLPNTDDLTAGDVCTLRLERFNSGSHDSDVIFYRAELLI